jgi:hypothetical protein
LVSIIQFKPSFAMKSLLTLFMLAMLTLGACSKRAQCPAYMDMSKGTISVQDTKKLSPGEIQEQSKKLLDTQDSYVAVIRDPKTGLVKSKKRVKRGKNNTNMHKGFKNDPRTLKGVN